jgi:putative addiction module killer protein
MLLRTVVVLSGIGLMHWMQLQPPESTYTLERVIDGNVSNVEPIGSGLSEIKLDLGPGHRIYFGKEGDLVLILLGGSSKKGQ